jgi:hypothetical protein
MKTKISRRKLMAAAAGTAVAAAQTPVPPQTDLAQAAREQNRRSGDVLTRFEIPLATEPAFHFKA